MIRTPDAAKSGASDTRSRILAAARELYASRGSRGTTTREVAELAGVNEATLFRHFGTKVALLSAMHEQYNGYGDMQRILARVGSLTAIEDQLRSLALAVIQKIKEREDLIRVSMAEELTNPEGLSCAWRAPSEAREMLVAWFGERTRAGELSGDPEWLARVFMSILFSFVMARRIWADIDQPDERSVAHLVEIFMNGARAR
jgi:AcrR family transcriptional regulator